MGRNISPQRRKTGFKLPKPKYLIVTGETKTETLYFGVFKNYFRISEVDIKVLDKGKSPVDIVKKARFQKERGKIDYDKIWCVFDVEILDNHKKDAEKALSQIKKHKFFSALTNPYFEYWYILHYDAVSPKITSREGMIEELKKYYPLYEKANSNILQDILDKTETAISNSKKVLDSNHFDVHDILNSYPSTNVHVLVEELMQFAGNNFSRA